MITHGTWGGVEDACVLCSSGASLLSAEHSDWATTYSSKDKAYSTNAIIFCNLIELNLYCYNENSFKISRNQY